MSTQYRTPMRSSDKFNSGTAVQTAPEQQGDGEIVINNGNKSVYINNGNVTVNNKGNGNGQAAAANAQKQRRDDIEYKTVNSSKPYLITGVVCALALTIGSLIGWHLVPTLIVTAVAGMIAYNSSKKKYQPVVYEIPIQHQLMLTGFAETDDVLKKADAELREIRKCSEKITATNPAFASTLTGLVADAYKIIDYTSENTNQITQLRRFFNYYLPTLEKLAKTYVALEKGGNGEKVTQTKEEIVSAAGAMESLFEKQIDKMYNNTAMDISTDVDVLESMLQSDGIQTKIN